MKPLRSILLATDLSSNAGRVLEQTANLAERCHARVDVLHVWQPPPGVSLSMAVAPAGRETLSDVARKQAMSLLTGLLSSSARYRTFRARVEVGSPHELIVTLALSERHDLIVLGAAGQSGVIGSVTRRVLDAAPCPVLTLRGSPGGMLDSAPQSSAQRGAG